MNQQILAAFTLLLATSLGCSRPYELARIEDYAWLNGELYFLIVRVAGVNTASRLAHSAAYDLQHQSVCVARASLSKSDVMEEMEVILSIDITSTSLFKSGTFRLCSSNSFVCTGPNAATRLVKVDSVTHELTETVLSDSRPLFTTTRASLVSCSPTPHVIPRDNTSQARNLPIDLVINSCGYWTGPPFSSCALTDDLRAGGVQQSSGETNRLFVLMHGAPVQVVPLPDPSFSLISVHTNAAGLQFLCTSFGHECSGTRAFRCATLIDQKGHELDRMGLPGDPVADTDASRIAAIPVGGMALFDQPIEVTLWSRSEHKSQTIALSSTKVLQSLRSTR